MTQRQYVLETDPLQPLLSPSPARVSRWVRGCGLLCAGYVAGVHLGLCDETYKEAPYLGAAFVAGALVLLIGASLAAAGRRFGRPATTLAWLASAAVMVAALLGFVLSRTTGLPSYHHVDWPPVQLVALVAEALYLVLTVIAVKRLFTS